jgi:hypothetical protein
MINNKTYKILIAAIVAISLCLTAWNHRDGISRFISPAPKDMSAYTAVDATIERVLPSGRGYRRTTILGVRYEYDGSRYAATVSVSGYVEGHYGVGDIITRHIDPLKPGELVEE